MMRRLLALAAALVALGAGSVPALASSGLTVTAVTPDTRLQQTFDDYSDSGQGAAPGHALPRWTGADSTYSAPLPGGADAWLFSDTFLGTVNRDGSRAADSPFIHNSIVLQGRDGLRTLTGGTPTQPQSLVGPTPTGPPTDPDSGNSSWYWSGDGIVEGDTLRVFNLQFVSTGTGAYDFRWNADVIASYHLPDMTPEGITPTYSEGDVTWGSWLVDDGPYTYVYGVEDLGSVKYMHLARAHRNDLLGAWQFYTGSGWSSDPDASARLMSGVANEYSVTRVAGRWVLVTFDTSVPFGNEIVAYTAPTPTGPFTDRTHIYSAPQTGGNIIAYNAHAHPELGGPDRMVISYNVNSLVVQDVYDQVQDYRPRFITVQVAP